MDGPLMPTFDMTGAVKCPRCADGYRHPVGNCVLCGSGPAPGAEDLPTDAAGRAAALAALAMAIAKERTLYPRMPWSGP